MTPADGTPRKAQYVGDEPDTLVRGQAQGSTPPPTVPVRPASASLFADVDIEPEVTTMSSAYALGDVLGRGGMGEVVLAHDRRIGRDVAIKRLRAAAPSEDDVSRFLREARIQARLEHPAIVPVYELARDDAGRPYFTMKRLAGVTLGDLIASPAPTRQRLLRAFADVCRAIDFAHSRGIVHRDLKPSNIVLGDFGEVYVLDWGVARVIERADAYLVTADIDTLEGAAPPGQVLGTPGYMAPEQLDRPDVDRPADVYALGAILFEILTGEPLHSRGEAAIASTRTTPSASPSRRRADRAIAPELDAACTAALAGDPGLRPTARRLADRIEDYLDGDRDVARRGTMANDLVWSAQVALDEDRRADAMRAASRALALDPEAPGAAELLTRLMLEPPRQPPAELDAALRQSDADVVRQRAHTGVLAYAAIALFLPIAIWNGVRRWDLVLAVTLGALAMAFAAVRLWRRPQRELAEMLAYAAGNAVLLALVSRMAGPFTFVPGLAVFMAMAMMAYPAFVQRPWLLIATIVAAFMLPIALEGIGWLATISEVRDGALIIRPGALAVGPATSVWMLIIASLATIVIAGIHSATLAKANRQLQHQLVSQAWHLRQLLPTAPVARA